MEIISGGILAGGKSKRMGVDKAQLIFKKDTFLQRSINVLNFFTKQILVSSNTEYLNIKYPIVKDEIQDIGPIGGLYTLLKKIKTQKLLILAVDTPLINKEVIAFLLKNYNPKAQISVFKTEDGLQMLVGIYDKSLLPIIEKQIENADYKLRNLLAKTNVDIILGDAFIRQFKNINTKKALEQLKTNTSKK